MKRTLLLLLAISIAACATGTDPAVTASAIDDFQPDARPTAKTMVYECDDAEFITRVGPGEMALWFEDRYLILSQVRAASGTKYQEGDVVFWSKGDQVIFSAAGVRYANCQINHVRAPWEDARRRGVDFRAVGNEPGWHLEVRGDQHLLFVGDYGATKIMFSNVQTTEDREQLHYLSQDDDNSINVTVIESACIDTMKGDQFPYNVQVQLNDRNYQGCGRTLDHPWE
ncbi:MAG: MliC family protein [Halioglobus sp.]|nr:hypothetical protein [Halieaceae bacterium]MDG1388388.1 MliC family protein [Halioglobus sp.]MDG2325381.1 MliC family protein [Halioglobus sp.]